MNIFWQIEYRFLWIYTLLLVVIIGCAAQGPAGGGPLDIVGPFLLQNSPENGELKITLDTQFIIEFSELIDPLSVPAAIKIIPNLEYRLKIRKSKLIIIPQSQLPKNSVIRIHISRRIRDHRGNEMDSPINLIYSTGDEIPTQSISGHLINFNPDKLHTASLNYYPPTDTLSNLLVVEVDNTGRYFFKNILPGIYTINSLEGNINEFSNQMRKNRYGMISENFLHLTNNENLEDIRIFMDEPIERLKINSIEFQNTQFGKVIYSDGSDQNYIIPWKSSKQYEKTPYLPGDTVVISIEKTNRLEKYVTPDFRFILPDILDTIPPKINHEKLIKDKLVISFSEPVQHWKNINEIPLENSPGYSIKGFNKQDTIFLDCYFLDPMTLQVIELSKDIRKIEIDTSPIKDIAGNIMEDSVLTISVNSSEIEEIIGGNIKGEVIYSGTNSILIQAENNDTSEKYYSIMGNYQFEFSNLLQGNYSVSGFEILNDLDSSVYFSGLWDPYNRSAKYGEHPEIVEVRSRWVIEGINIEIY